MHSRTLNPHAFQDGGGLGWWRLASAEQCAPAARVPHSPLGLIVAQPVGSRKATASTTTVHHSQAACIPLSVPVTTGPLRDAFLSLLPLFPSSPQVPARRIILCLLPALPATPSEVESSPLSNSRYHLPISTPTPSPLSVTRSGLSDASRTLRMKIHADHQNEN